MRVQLAALVFLAWLSSIAGQPASSGVAGLGGGLLRSGVGSRLGVTALNASFTGLEENESESIWETLGRLRQQFTPVGESIIVTQQQHTSGSQGSTQSPGSSGTTPWPESSRECAALRPNVAAQITAALKLGVTWVVQEGELDWGFLGTEGETQTCAGETCAYTNPSSPYGLTVLPLTPREVRDGGADAKINAPTTPNFAKADLAQRSANSSAPRGVIASLGATSTGAVSAVFQLVHDEAMVIAGCLPHASATRYFGITPYIHSVWDDARKDWSSVFSSLGDTLSLYTQPDGGGAAAAAAGPGVRNRINSTLPSVVQAASMQQSVGAPGSPLGGGLLGRLAAGRSGRLGRRLHNATHTDPLANSSSSAGRTSRPWADLDLQLQQLPQDLLNPLGTSIRQAQSGAGAAGAGSSDPCGQFTVVVVTASRATAQRVEEVLRPVMREAGLESPNSPLSWHDTPTSRTASDTSPLNLYPIPPPFTEGMGLHPRSPYFMMLARNIVPAGQLADFREYAERSPWSVWRLTPRVGDGAATLLQRARPTDTDAAPPTNQARQDMFPQAKVVSRLPDSSDRDSQQNEIWLRPAYEALNQALIQKLTALGYALSWSIGSDSAFGSVGVDWGIDCYSRRISICNGDNRDAQYYTSLPLVTLDTFPKVAWATGVNHVASGLASYTNIAPTDPIQQLGLSAWDNDELVGSADDLLAGTPHAALSKYLYAVAFARNCSGLPFCKEIPTEGPRSVPRSRGMLVMLRAYVNPATGVGPDPSRLIPFRTVVATPRSEAGAWDTRPYKSDAGNAASPCRTSLLNTVLTCASTPSFSASLSSADVAANPVQAVRDVALSAVASNAEGRGPGYRLGRLADALPDANSACCKASTSWAEEKCWCSDAGKELLDAVAPVAGRSMVVGVGRVCGQRTGPTSCLAGSA